MNPDKRDICPQCFGPPGKTEGCKLCRTIREFERQFDEQCRRAARHLSPPKQDASPTNEDEP